MLLAGLGLMLLTSILLLSGMISIPYPSAVFIQYFGKLLGVFRICSISQSCTHVSRESAILEDSQPGACGSDFQKMTIEVTAIKSF